MALVVRRLGFGTKIRSNGLQSLHETVSHEYLWQHVTVTLRAHVSRCWITTVY